MQEQSQPEDQDAYDELEYNEQVPKETEDESTVLYRERTSNQYRELISEVAAASGYYKYEVRDVLDCLSYCIANRMVVGKKSQIDNLGTFHMRVHPPRMIHLPGAAQKAKKMKMHLTESIIYCLFNAAVPLKAALKEKQREKEFQEALVNKVENERI